MKTTLKRLTALILALSMTLSLFSTGAWAADLSSESSEGPAVSSAGPEEGEAEEAAPEEAEAEAPAPEEGSNEEAKDPAESATEPKEEQPTSKKQAKQQLLTTQDDPSGTAWESDNSLPTESGDYYLTKNVTLTGTWTPPDGETMLCLNGHTISANGGNYPVITVNKAEKIVNIYDENNEGKITGSNYNGNGGGISITAGHVTLHGGKIEGNRASNGGGVSVMGENAQFSMSGGSIQYNEGYNNTGGVLLGSNGCFTMSGGTIQYNVGKNFGGIGTATTKMEFSGDIQIKDNFIFSNLSSSVRKITNTSGSYEVAEGGTACDVKMSNDTDMISVVGALAETAEIGVFNTRLFTNSANTDFNVAARFFSNVANFNVAKGSNGQLRLVRGTLDSVFYREASWNETTRTVDYTDKTVANPIAVEEGTTSWTDGNWYVVNSGVTVSNRITVTGTANLILCDGCSLTAKKGIQVSEGNTLNIYAQSENSGSITATGPKAGRGAGIGGNNADGQRNAGHIVIHGGNITANWEQDCNSAGIGGGQNGTGGTIDIYGGKITATGHGHYGAGIGGAGSGSSGTITIYGGNIVAEGNCGGAGIGGGKDGKCDTITINGGVVRAWGGQGGMNSAGIGGGHGKPGGTIIINGGDVLARGGHGRPGIGAGALPTTDIDQGTLKIAPGMVVRATIGDSKYNKTAKNPCLDYVEKRENCVRVWSHTHHFTYTASGDTLTGTCSNPDCNYINGKIDVQFVAEDTPYDNTPHGVTLSCKNMCHGLEDFYLDTDVSATAKVLYQKKTGDAYGTATETVPTDPGTYKASITLGEGEGAATANVEYTITNDEYSITTPTDNENGTVTADRTSAKFSDVTTLTITPAEGKELTSINATCGVLTQMPLDSPTEKLTYTLTGITEDTTVTATFGKLETYTVLYNAKENPEQVYCRVGSDSTRYEMTQNINIGSLNCWALPTKAADDAKALSVSFSTDGTTWSDAVDAAVEDSVPATLTEGQTVAVRGETNVFALVFASDDATIVSQYYLVTPDTTSITVTNPTKNGYTFGGWMYSTKSTAQDPEKDEVSHSQQIAAGDGSTVISVNGTFTETTLLSALWKLDNCQVSYDLNGGTGSASSATVRYGNKATKPTDPTKSGYAFVRWVVAENTTQRIGNNESTVLAGAAFDFANTSVINNLKLKAEWKHVHSYVCLPLDHSAFGGAFQEYVNAGYTQYLHIKICTSMDDYCAEAHSFDSNGKCACGYTKPVPTVKLTKSIDEGAPTAITVTRDQVVSISAPQTSKGKKFARWEYSGDGQNWKTLTTNSYAAFAIPQDMYVRAVYQPEMVVVSVDSFMDEGKLVFFFDYSVPDGWKVLDGGLLSGENSNLRYMELRYGGRATPYYLPSSGNAIAKFGAKTVGERIFYEQPISGGGKPTPYYKRPSVLGKTACCAITYPNTLIANYGGNYYTYGMGFIVCQKPDGSKMGYKTEAIWASKNSPDHKIYDVWNAN